MPISSLDLAIGLISANGTKCNMGRGLISLVNWVCAFLFLRSLMLSCEESLDLSGENKRSSVERPE